MKARSAVEPNWYFLKQIKRDGALVLRIRWDVHQVSVEDMDGKTHLEYEYNEEIINHIPIQSIASDEVTSYIEAHQSELLAEAQNTAIRKEIGKMDLETVRKQPLKPEFVSHRAKAKADIAANPIPENLSATPANIAAIKIRIENIEKILGLK